MWGLWGSGLPSLAKSLMWTTLTEGTTYVDTGNKSVWVHGEASGLDKRQCTMQLTVFANGESKDEANADFQGYRKADFTTRTYEV